MSPSSPYLSVVVTSRNDDHGGDAMVRMKRSFECTLRQLEKYNIPAEFILVDWNPPDDRPPLREALDWPGDLKRVSIRIIEVPGEIHKRFPGHERLGLFQNIARNAGIRRARGEYALASMIDLLYPDEVMAFLARKPLRPGQMYRVERIDVDSEVLKLGDIQSMLDYCPEHVIRRNPRSPNSLHPGLPPLFTNACGDFQLLSLDAWHRLRGQREDDPTMLHIDSIVAYGAYGMGIRETIIENACVYHIDHSGGWDDIRDRKEVGDTGKSADELWPVYEELMVGLGLGNRSYDFNDENWGLGGEDLPEYVPSRAEWEES